MENPYPFNSCSPMDGLQDSMHVLDLLDCLISGCPDLSLLDRCDGNDSVSGLVSLVGAIRKNIAIAAEELDGQLEANLDQKLQEAEERGVRAGRIMQKMVGSKNNDQQDDDVSEKSVESYPKLSVRDHAIIATYRQGHPIEEIAKAVNLKKQTVQRMIDQLRDSGAISDDDQAGGKLDTAATA
jgi:hypothetical protein